MFMLTNRKHCHDLVLVYYIGETGQGLAETIEAEISSLC
jgi:hypothetical protein